MTELTTSRPKTRSGFSIAIALFLLGLIGSGILWWQGFQGYAIITFISMLLIALIVAGYTSPHFRWTGFGTDTSQLDDQGRPIQRAKTLWDWLRLLLLPVVLIVGILWLNGQQQQLLLQQEANARQLAEEQHQQVLLSSYMDKISDLILHDDLLHTKPLSAIHLVAQVQTTTTLRALQPDKKGALIHFLYTSQLINNDTHVISLLEADLRGADLHNLDLRDTNLSGAYMSGANLAGANLSYTTLKFTDLSNSNMSGANLQAADMHNTKLNGADLSKAVLLDAQGLQKSQLASVKSLKGAIMVDSTKHP
ncbi:hypothetical protein EPA93_12655 [Ktedonosporobacter rubrisoli]|uniref:Pentapeptide repeat-containing protein n=1 Tax=Ktedonosporobacter rubrisoli TaxID=2509675 RepID=A0A4P6JNC1_KTERU|nr:pentapeptide repeat-containing protein [Ktedonosporobacter rubrisoli]QBD76807.1 hypothetical protein EPA93_12655 [Ktedonosporobacter rubrisoli]